VVFKLGEQNADQISEGDVAFLTTGFLQLLQGACEESGVQLLSYE